MAAGAVNGILYTLEGISDNLSSSSAFVTVEAYDPVTDTWTTKASMPTARGWLSAAVLDGVLYALGGVPGGFGSALATVEAFIPEVIPQIGSVVGRVIADCPVADTALLGVTVDAFEVGTGDLAGSDSTDVDGDYQIDDLPAGDYTVTVVKPLGYNAAPEEIEVSVTGGDVVTVDFRLTCLNITPNQRTIGYWKHQVGVATGGKGKAQVDAASLCDYLDLIEGHFNSNSINQVIVYEPPDALACLPDPELELCCREKLWEAKDLLNLKGNVDMTARARQQLTALLLNVASGRLSLWEPISVDSATVSQAITRCDRLIDDPKGDHERAKTIADMINCAKPIPAGMIGLTTENIAYSPRANDEDLPRRSSLGQSYPNPFNPQTTIEFSIRERANVSLKIYNVAGQLVYTWPKNGVMGGGKYTATWKGLNDRGRPVASGVYFYKLVTKGFSETRKMVIVK